MDVLSLFVTLTQFLRNVRISLQDFIAAEDGSIIKKCLIIKTESCSTIYKNRKDFCFVCAPFLNECLEY